MDCREYREVISTHVDRGLTLRERLQVQSRPCTNLTGRQRSRSLVIVMSILFLAVVVFAASVAQAGSPAPEDLKKLKLVGFSPPVKAPDFVLTDLQGKEVSLGMYRGKPLLLYFWATW